MPSQKPAEIQDSYKGNFHGALVKYPGRIAAVCDINILGYERIMQLSGAKVLQEYHEINMTALEILVFSANHMNRGVKFGDLSKLLS